MLLATCAVFGKDRKVVEARKSLSLTDGKTCNPTLKNWTKAGVQDWLETNDLKHLQTRCDMLLPSVSAVNTGADSPFRDK